MKKHLLLFCLLISGFTYGQITITQSDFANSFSVGLTYLSYMTPLGVTQSSVFVGQPSSVAQSWDFTGFTFNYVAKSQTINPVLSPFYTTFPNATIVLRERTWILNKDTSTTYSYHNLTAQELQLLGLSDDTTIYETYDPPVVHATVPLTYGSAWTSERDSTEIFPGYYIIRQTSCVADAFGTITIPSGNYQCLRVNQLTTSITHTPVSTDTTQNQSYQFFGKGIIEVNILGILGDQINQPTVDAGGIKISQREGQSGIADHGTRGEASVLEQNFPNPFSCQTVIRYTLAEESPVLLTVVDFLGKEVATLVNERQQQGNHEVVFHPDGFRSGIYSYQLKTGDRETSRKMIIVR